MLFISKPDRIVARHSQIVFRVCQHKGCMAIWIASGDGNARNRLRCFYSTCAAGQSDEPLVKVIQPRAQHTWVVMAGIGRDEYHLESINYVLGHSCQRRSDIGHLHGTHTAAMCVAEKQLCDVSVGL